MIVLILSGAVFTGLVSYMLFDIYFSDEDIISLTEWKKEQ